VRRLTSLAVAASATAAIAVVVIAGGVAGAHTTSSKLPVLKLALNGKSVKVSGSKVSGAVTVQTTVTKEKAGEPSLFQFAPGKSVADFAKCVAPVNKHHGDLNYLDPCGKLIFDAVAPKGTSSAQTVLKPGNYLALDIIGKTPRFAPFTVTKSMSPAKLPKPAGQIASIEFGFRGADKLKDGELVRFVNDGFLVHMDVYVRVRNVADARKVVRLLLAGKNGAAGKLAIGQGTFAGPVSSGGLQQLKVTAKPGVYVQACFMQTQDGRDHTQLGMERIFFVKK
jgi:hypothetical protein